MQWKIFVLTDQEAATDLCTGWGYAKLNENRWIDSTYGAYSPEDHFDINVEHMIIDNKAYVITKIYQNEVEGYCLMVIRRSGAGRDDPEYVKKHAREYGIVIPDSSGSGEEVPTKVVQSQRIFQNIFPNKTN